MVLGMCELSSVLMKDSFNSILMQMSERWGHRKLRLYRVHAELNGTGFNSNN